MQVTRKQNSRHKKEDKKRVKVTCSIFNPKNTADELIVQSESEEDRVRTGAVQKLR